MRAYAHRTSRIQLIPSLQVHQTLCHYSKSSASPFFEKPKEFWKVTENQVSFLDWLGKELNYKSLSDWYSVQKRDFTARGGTPLLNLFDGSPIKALTELYKNHQWEAWKFARIARRELPDDETKMAHKYIHALELDLKIKNKEDWYSVSQKQIDEFGGVTALRRYGGLEKALHEVYPEHQWDSKKLESIRKKSHQRWLRVMLSRLFPGKKIFDEYEHPDIQYSVSKEQMQFDIFIPDLKLAVEYYGPHHYREVPFFGPRRHILDRDEDKRQMCKKHNLTLLEIPYWWDDTRESLVATIDQVRPDLVKDEPKKGTPIPSRDPKLEMAEPKKKTDIMNLLLTPLTWHDEADPKDWWMVESYFGIKVYWDGNFLSSRRSGNHFPPHMHEGLPPFALEGVVWMQGSTNFLRTKDPDNWKDAILYIIDSPTPTLNTTYEERLEKMKAHKYPEHVKLLLPTKCNGKQHLKDFFAQVEAKGGDGVLLKKPKSAYADGSLYSYKHYDEMYVKLIGVNERSHRLLTEMDNGDALMVSCQHQTLTHPPPMGTPIKIRYTNRNGTVAAPCFVAASDLKWEAAKMENHKLHKAKK